MLTPLPRHLGFKKLAQTIYGEVSKAYDTKLERNIVIKFSQAQERKYGEDPLNEVLILDKLWFAPQSRPYVIQLLERGTKQKNGRLYYWMVLEYAEGGDMLERVSRVTNMGGQMSLSRIRRYVTMLAQGIFYIHQHGVSHLDLSMENILITKQDEIRICDFGQAEQKRFCRGRKGKEKYISPEVLSGEEYDGFKVDVWSAGIVLWVMLTGGFLYRVPKLKDARFELLTQGKAGIEKLLEQDEVTDVPDQVVDLLSHMLTTDVTQRYLIEDVLAHPWISCPVGSSPRPKVPPLLSRVTEALTPLDLSEKEKEKQELTPNQIDKTKITDSTQSEA